MDCSELKKYLKGYYENNKRNFTSRELRKLGLLILDPEELAKAIDIGADELKAYWDLGIDEFILSGYPHVEEARRVAEDLLPLARDRMN